MCPHSANVDRWVLLISNTINEILDMDALISVLSDSRKMGGAVYGI